MTRPVRILGIAGSRRRESYNRAALRAVTTIRVLPSFVPMPDEARVNSDSCVGMINQQEGEI